MLHSMLSVVGMSKYAPEEFWRCCNVTFNAKCGGYVINRSVRLKTRYPGKAVLIDNRLERTKFWRQGSMHGE